MADQLAAGGYVTVVPDLFDGDCVSPEPFFRGKIDLPKWLARHTTMDIDPLVDVVINHLKHTLNVKKVAGVGYCFGAKVSEKSIHHKKT